MKFILSFFLSILFFVLLTREAKAIIVAVPVILIPIVKVLAVVIGTLATPTIGLSVLYHKMNKKPIGKGLAVGFTVLIILSLLILLILKIINPERPIY